MVASSAKTSRPRCPDDTAGAISRTLDRNASISARDATGRSVSVLATLVSGRSLLIRPLAICEAVRLRHYIYVFAAGAARNMAATQRSTDFLNGFRDQGAVSGA